MASSFRQVATTMDRANPPRSLRELATCYRWHGANPHTGELPPRPVSFRMISERHAAAISTTRFLSYNTYLLRVDIPVEQFFVSYIGLDHVLELFSLSALDVLGKLNITPQRLVELGIVSWVAVVVAFSLNPLVGLGFLTSMSLLTFLDTMGLTPLDVLGKVLKALDMGIIALLDVFGIELPAVHTEPKPALEERAIRIGTVLKSTYDVAALSEVWQLDSRARILSAWGDVVPHHTVGPEVDSGDAAQFVNAGSGLCVISQSRALHSTGYDKEIFDVQGVDRWKVGLNLGRLVDSDAWAKKGVLRTMVDVGGGHFIEIYNTHLYSGGDMPSWLDLDMSAPSPEEKRAIRLRQVDDLLDFFRATHDPANVALIVGDFNIDATNLDTPTANEGPTPYNALIDKMAAVGMVDAWAWQVAARPGVDQFGGTHGPADPDHFRGICEIVEESGNSPYYYCSEQKAPTRNSSQGRIDYFFIEQPTLEHNFMLDITRIRRVPFPQGGLPDGELFLSDHLGYDVTLIVSPRIHTFAEPH